MTGWVISLPRNWSQVVVCTDVVWHTSLWYVHYDISMWSVWSWELVPVAAGQLIPSGQEGLTTVTASADSYTNSIKVLVFFFNLEPSCRYVLKDLKSLKQNRWLRLNFFSMLYCSSQRQLKGLGNLSLSTILMQSQVCYHCIATVLIRWVFTRDENWTKPYIFTA